MSLFSFSSYSSATNKQRYFRDFRPRDFARSGAVASREVTIPAGPQNQFTPSMVEHLRKLGMPMDLKDGILSLPGDYTICREGDILTPEQAKLLVTPPAPHTHLLHAHIHASTHPHTKQYLLRRFHDRLDLSSY